MGVLVKSTHDGRMKAASKKDSSEIDKMSAWWSIPTAVYSPDLKGGYVVVDEEVSSERSRSNSGGVAFADVFNDTDTSACSTARHL